jgi:hypothetical protein
MMHATRELSNKEPRSSMSVLRICAILVGAELAVALGFADVAAAQAKADSFQEHYQSFKNQPRMPQSLTFWGPDAAQCVRLEPEGLRLTLPVGHAGVRPATGVATGMIVKGDFEITALFEILREPKPAHGRNKQTRFTVDIVLDRPGLNAASLSRTVYGQGFEFVTWSALQPDGAQKPKIQMDYLPGADQARRLRLVRRGSMLLYYGSKGADDDFKLLKQHPFGPEDLKDVRLVGSTGDAAAALEARVSELRVRAESLPGLAADDAGGVGGTVWLLMVLALFLAAVLCVGLWHVARRRRRSNPPQTH